MAIATLRRLTQDSDESKTYHGIEVLTLHVGDPIPTPRAPQCYAVRVTPDLARYLLTFNHERQRTRRERHARRYAADMASGAWAFNCEAIAFTKPIPTLENGQNRLLAVTIYGGPVWFLVWFGWPNDSIIKSVDGGAARSPADAFKVDAVPSARLTAASVSLADLYQQTVGTSMTWGSRLKLSTPRALNAFHADEELWHEAIKIGQRIYVKYRSLTAPTWAAVYYVIAHELGERDQADAFFEEFLAGAGAPDSPTRRLETRYVRAKVSETRTGDSREHLENIIRGFNAWVGGARLSFVGVAGFTLTRPRVS